MEGQENIQEILSKQLLLCQFLTAISTLRTGVCVCLHVHEWLSHVISLHTCKVFLDFLKSQSMLLYSPLYQYLSGFRAH